jgi:hypothetical protein
VPILRCFGAFPLTEFSVELRRVAGGAEDGQQHHFLWGRRVGRAGDELAISGQAVEILGEIEAELGAHFVQGVVHGTAPGCIRADELEQFGAELRGAEALHVEMDDPLGVAGHLPALDGAGKGCRARQQQDGSQATDNRVR